MIGNTLRDHLYDDRLDAFDERVACRRMVGLLALAHACCREPALAAGRLLARCPNWNPWGTLRLRSEIAAAQLNVRRRSPTDYNDLLETTLTNLPGTGRRSMSTQESVDSVPPERPGHQSRRGAVYMAQIHRLRVAAEHLSVLL